jgi:hypothetical protein
MQWDGTDIQATQSAIFSFIARKVAGEAKASAVMILSDIGDIHPLTLVVDTTTSVDHHILKIGSVGVLGYPYNDLKISASLTYTQIKQ